MATPIESYNLHKDYPMGEVVVAALRAVDRVEEGICCSAERGPSQKG